MELLKKISQLCRQHYEKIILLLSLAILGGAVVFLFLERAKQENEQEKTQGKYRAAKGKAPPALNVTYYQGVLQSLQNPPKLDLGLPHHLFNPVKWQRRIEDGSLIPVRSEADSGPTALVITKIVPLNTVINLDPPSKTPTTSPGFYVGAMFEAATNRLERAKRTYFCVQNTRSSNIQPNKLLPPQYLTLREFKGPVEDPTEVALDWTVGDATERITIGKDKPFTRTEAYTADLRYDREKLVFAGKRVGERITFDGDAYIIVAINSNNIVLSSSLNEKPHVVGYAPTR